MYILLSINQGLLAALAADSSRIHDTLQLALCHLFFNISGILLFYPIPWMRWPIPLAKLLGNITAQYRWFSVLYLVCAFFLFPVLVFALSLLGPVAFGCIGGPILVALLVIIVINLVQNYHPEYLPRWFRDWSFLPEWARSLAPADRGIEWCSERLGCSRLSCCQSKLTDEGEDDLGAIEVGVTEGVIGNDHSHYLEGIQVDAKAPKSPNGGVDLQGHYNPNFNTMERD